MMAIKDEYEVARLYTDGEFLAGLREAFEGEYTLTFHMAPPALDRLFGGRGPKKREFGQWMMRVLKVLARLKRIRGTWLDPIRFNAERKAEQAWLERYVQNCNNVASMLDGDNVDAALELLGAFDAIRGYGHVKEANAEKALVEIAELETRWQECSLREPTPIASRVK